MVEGENLLQWVDSDLKRMPRHEHTQIRVLFGKESSV